MAGKGGKESMETERERRKRGVNARHHHNGSRIWSPKRRDGSEGGGGGGCCSVLVKVLCLT